MQNEKRGELNGRERVIITGCPHDCGGKCLLKVHVKEGVITRIESDDGEEPQLRACLRGRAYRQRVYSPHRLKFPMKRVGERGKGEFKRISWDEALDTVANELKRIKKTYGPTAILHIVQWPHTFFHGRNTVSRLLSKFGGFTPTWGDASDQGSHFAAKYTYGSEVGHTRDDILNSRMIIMWGFNPAVTIQDTNTSFYLAKAKEKGIKIICVDPRFTDSAAIFADQWIPIRPDTDAAMMIAMAYVILKENLEDRAFLNKYAVGLDQFKEYIFGTEDGVPKTPTWAEAVTGVPAITIENLAREYANTKPAALIAGLAPGRTAYGEQYHRAAAVLTVITGNVGIHGGHPASFHSFGRLPRPSIDIKVWPSYLPGSKQVEGAVHISKVWDAILRGRAGGYPSGIKMLYVSFANPVNQYPNVNRAVKALMKLEFIVVHEQFMTATARFADILLPINTHLERNDVGGPWFSGSYYIYYNKAIDPLYESKSDFEICCELATRLDIEDYSDKTEDEWLREMFRSSKVMADDIGDYDRFKEEGVRKIRFPEPLIAFEKQIKDPKNHPFPTPSGKIEIYSQRLADINDSKLPAIPKYIETWESPNDPLADKYPLQLITVHFRSQCHSIFDNTPWLRQVEPQTIWINPVDARTRDINNRDRVRIFNDRGAIVVPAKVTERIMPGVVSIGEGAWYRPDEEGVDMGGCVNVLCRDEHSPGGAFCSNTCLVQVQKV